MLQAVDKPLVTISVVSHGHGELLRNLFEDLDRQIDISIARIVLTLNKYNEAFDCSNFKNIKIEVIENLEPKGFGANHNAAFLRCETEYFLILNPDIRLPSNNAVRDLLNIAISSGQRGLYAPEVKNSSGCIEDSVRGNLSPYAIFLRALKKERPCPRDVPAKRGGRFFWVAGMAMLIGANEFRDVGGFDERYFLYCEDYDICARLFLSGYVIRYVDNVEFIHDAQRDSHRSWGPLKLHLASLAKVWMSRAYWAIVIHRLRHLGN